MLHEGMGNLSYTEVGGVNSARGGFRRKILAEPDFDGETETNNN